MEIAKIGTQQIVILIIGLVIMIAAPVAIAIVWKIKKKEKFTTILVGAVTFLLFALIIEKPIQSILLFPTQMGLPNHSASLFFEARPVLLALMIGLFPGVFEETGRFLAFKTVLKNRKNRETSISYGIGHGCFEVLLLMGLTYFQNIFYAVMINNGTFSIVIDQLKELAPDQVDSLYAMAGALAKFSVGDLGLGVLERCFAVLFHVGASVLVFYACKDKKKIWLYPLAILLHTLIDATVGLTVFAGVELSTWAIEAMLAVVGIATFVCGYYFLYKKDTDTVDTVLEM